MSTVYFVGRPRADGGAQGELELTPFPLNLTRAFLRSFTMGTTKSFVHCPWCGTCQPVTLSGTPEKQEKIGHDCPSTQFSGSVNTMTGVGQLPTDRDVCLAASSSKYANPDGGVQSRNVGLGALVFQSFYLW